MFDVFFGQSRMQRREVLDLKDTTRLKNIFGYLEVLGLGFVLASGLTCLPQHAMDVLPGLLVFEALLKFEESFFFLPLHQLLHHDRTIV